MKHWWKQHRMLVFLLAFAATLVFFRIEYRTFWMDETFVLQYLPMTAGEFVHEYFYNPDNHPPLYYFSVLFTSWILPQSEFMVRLPSALFGIGIVWLVYRLMQAVTGKERMAVTAAALTALSANFVLLSQMARYHTMAAFASLFALYHLYLLYKQGFSRRHWLWFLFGVALTGYSDYPPFIYLVIVTQLMYFGSVVFKRQPVKAYHWLLGHISVGVVCSPMVWFLYHRIFIQGDGQFDVFNNLGNGLVNIIGGTAFHFYSYLFAEHIFPWEVVPFGLGVLVLIAAGVGGVRYVRSRWRRALDWYVPGLAIGVIVLNTLFINVANPRYNFIVYPKFGYVAYPLLIMSFVLAIESLPWRRIRQGVYALWIIVALIALGRFYSAESYLNPSYFRTFDSFTFIEERREPGQYLAMTNDAGVGLFNFYRESTFRDLEPLEWYELPVTEPGTEVWFVATGFDGPVEGVSPYDRLPEGYEIVEEYLSVPLEPTFKSLKERALRRPSYTYKYGVFLIKKL